MQLSLFVCSECYTLKTKNCDNYITNMKNFIDNSKMNEYITNQKRSIRTE